MSYFTTRFQFSGHASVEMVDILPGPFTSATVAYRLTMSTLSMDHHPSIEILLADCGILIEDLPEGISSGAAYWYVDLTEEQGLQVLKTVSNHLAKR